MVPVVILAGGGGTRMGEVGKMIPKFLLPVNGEILLMRTLRQAIEKQYDNIIICTRLEYVDKINSLVFHLGHDNGVIKIKYANETSLFESLKSLGEDLINIDEFVLVLGDIYYVDNPFVDLPTNISFGDVLVGKTVPKYSLEFRLGGVVETDSLGKVMRVVKKPSMAISQGTRWSGMSLCGKNFFDDLRGLSDKIDVSLFSLEDIFDYRNSKYHSSTVIDKIEFVNINSSLHHVYANLLALGTTSEIDDKVKSVSLMCAGEIKELILRNGHQL